MKNQINPVKQLPNEVARKIAAGEVIDRPNAVIRELLDNAIDSGATEVTAEIEGGGIDKIRIVDNGIGLSKEDLQNCAKPHATSKITSETDLMNLSTLGFRGEALASIASVSRLDITSHRDDQAYHLETFIDKENEITPANLARGTIVQSQALFENFPARRLFLKRPSSEGSLCKQTFIEKSLPFTDITFKFYMDGKIKLNLLKGQTKTQRFISALELAESSSLFAELHNDNNLQDKTYSFDLIIGEPSVNRNDKKLIYIYVNGRRIQEYALIQAIEYGCQGYFPNGTHPVAVLYLEINPSLVDFNIHPAKKEVRFKDIAPIHHAIYTTVKNYFSEYTASFLTKEIDNDLPFTKDLPYTKTEDISLPKQTSKNYFDFEPNKTPTHNTNNSYSSNISKFDYKKNIVYPEFIRDSFIKKDDDTVAEKEEEYTSNNFSFYGSIYCVFLMAQKDGVFYLIDQHAGHERILFNQFMEHAGEKQNLLISYNLYPQNTEDEEYLLSIKETLEEAGFTLQKTDDSWRITTVPIKWKGTEKELQKDILENHKDPKEIIRLIAATTSCRQAVKDGDLLDYDTARNLAKDILELPDPHCPHGRPVYTILTKEELFKRVRRTE